jgi:hypothetical protein
MSGSVHKMILKGRHEYLVRRIAIEMSGDDYGDTEWAHQKARMRIKALEKK